MSHAFGLAINNKEQIDVIAIDFSKAFDRVCHTKLIEKLYKLGVNKQIVKWIHAYFRNRKPYVQIAGERSSFLPVLSGVPQGSVLGPILFLLYVNDIANDIDSNIELRLFADDCLIYCRVKNVDEQVLLKRKPSKNLRLVYYMRHEK